MKRIIPLLCALLLSLSGCLPRTAAVDAARETRRIPILMYHSILRDPDRKGKYVLSPDLLEEDVRYLLDHGYETVSCGELAAFASGAGSLPEKPVLLTFDDGYLNNLTYALPLMEQYGCHAVVSVVGAYTERFSETPDPNPNYAHLSWEQVRAITEGGFIEIQNHSWNMHGQAGRKGSMRKAGESDAAYAAAFTEDLMRLQRTLTAQAGITPTFFAYPFGLMDPLSKTLLKEMGFIGSFSCREKISAVTRGEPDSLFGLCRFNRPGNLSTSDFMEHVFDESDLP